MLAFILILTVFSFVEPIAVNVTGKNQPCCGNCFLYGCPSGQCCSQYGYCGATREHCEKQIQPGQCKTEGCPPGLCCSKFGYCGSTAEHCDNTPLTDGNCPTVPCPPGYCCSKHGFCGNTPEHCGNSEPTGDDKDCRVTGCAPGLCCSRFGYCGSTPEHCAGTPGWPVPACPTCTNVLTPNCGNPNGCAGKK